ncbi:DUF6191 domain-containing protein [Kitasatospora sp. NPDC097605]|uniref:DUF6191 domain-containing protein n=1 Tax=Kitasatospora sp. NPDC097605 TaxID=3157226 RepID=UPI00331A359D
MQAGNGGAGSGRWVGMVMMSGLLLMAVLVIVPFTLAAVRHVVVRAGRPGWLARRLAARTPGGGVGLGATATEELHAFLNANKRVQIEQRRTQLVLRDDDHSGAPPRTRLDLDLGIAVMEEQR